VAATSSARIEREFADPVLEAAKPKTDKALDEVFALDKTASQVNRPSKVDTGRKVSLEFSDADIRKIFQLIAEVSNQNFLVSDDVTGTISLKLVNVPWDQALEVILENKGLGMQKDGNIVQIRPKTKMKSLDDEAIEMRITEEKKLPLSTVIFDINFATLGEIEKQFKNLKSKRLDSSIASDVRTNKIIVVDIDPNIKKMRKLLESLDIPEKQVMIEARIVEASSDFTRAMGVQWGFGYQDGSASVANINNITGTMGGVVTTGAATGGLATGISFGKLMSNIQLDMRLSASASLGQTKIISTPRVLTVNNKAAKITSGTMVPYQNTSSAEGAKTEFVEAALSLEVTPHITADGSVSMKIKASNNSVGSGSPPPINKQEATTELVLRNGETTVIGGIYKDNESEGDVGVPYLSDIPLLGWLFKSNTKTKTRSELLIFITPKIMN
jgi:type IV pilus assembly protein PilQ